MAVRGKVRDDRWEDYNMSKLFGLNWKSYDYKRMREFILMMQIESNLAQKK